MDLIVLALRVIVIAVLAVSGVAKLFDRDGSREAMIGFGVPLRLVPVAAICLPWLEIALAIGLVFAPTLLWAATATLLLFLVFTFGVLRVMLAGESLECHCFGQLSARPISWFTVARNIALSAAAGIILWYAAVHGTSNLWDDFTWRVALWGFVAVVIAAMALVIVHLWRTQQALLDRIDELQALIPTGRITRPPAEEAFARRTATLTVMNLEGERVPVPQLRTPNRPTLLIFVSEKCRACTALLPDIAAWQQEFAGVMSIVVIGAGETAALAQHTSALDIANVYHRADESLTALLQVNGNPSAVLIDHDGFVRQKPMLGGAAVRRLVNELRIQATQHA